jgi:hypothetical protein
VGGGGGKQGRKEGEEGNGASDALGDDSTCQEGQGLPCCRQCQGDVETDRTVVALC